MVLQPDLTLNEDLLFMSQTTYTVIQSRKGSDSKVRVAVDLNLESDVSFMQLTKSLRRSGEKGCPKYSM